MEPIFIIEKKQLQYEIVIESDFSSLKDKALSACPQASKILLVTDKNVNKLYAKSVSDLFDLEVFTHIIPAGEKSKSKNEAEKIIQKLYNNKFTRDDIVMSLGGGVVSDLAGFCASVYGRGINHIIIPTTLLAMADASIGGKTAIDYMDKKNLIGAFHNPVLIYDNTETLNTLPSREYFAGFAEIMKAGLLYNDKFYIWLIENMYEICEKENNTLSEMLKKAIEIKKVFVEKDPYEKTGERKLLNLGHTIGHGIESVLGDEYIHGECVSLGCVAAAYISYKLNYISSDDYYEIRDMFVPFYLPISIETDKIDDILEAVTYDKKNTGESINMILLKKIGKAFLCENVSKELIKEAITELNFKEEG